MFRNLAIAVFMLSLNAFAPGETRWMALNGNVVDAETGQAIIGARIQLKGHDLVVYSDPEGNFEMAAQVKADSEVVVEYITYEDEAISALKLLEQKTIALKAH